MRVIAIYKFNDNPGDDPILSRLPVDYPLECSEFDSALQATLSYPNATIMTIDEYKAYKASFQAAYNAAIAEI